MPNPIRISHRYEQQDGKGDCVAHVEVKDVDGVLWLTNLWVAPEQRNNGRASALMTAALIEWQARDLYLSVEPYTDQPLAAAQLRSYYRDYGFAETVVPGVMHRAPAPWPPPEPIRTPSSASIPADARPVMEAHKP